MTLPEPQIQLLIHYAGLGMTPRRMAEITDLSPRKIREALRGRGIPFQSAYRKPSVDSAHTPIMDRFLRRRRHERI